ncbi:MAG: TIGR04076 family protein [Oscillospiraceae bacterium]|nr:TIGR04076 family protein [Oscillospiraceae bacterium]MBQ6849668.1 TIGR04076 family protein [Oscillospiraceae bacterium]
MAKIKLTVTESRCRSGYFKSGDTFVVEDLCPPLCHELWHVAYPYVFALQNGGTLDEKDSKTKKFTCRCPDESRVVLVGEVLE